MGTAEVLDSTFESALRSTEVLVDRHIHVSGVAGKWLWFATTTGTSPLVLGHV